MKNAASPSDGEGAMGVRVAERSDVPAIAEIHVATFPKSAMTMLGGEVVRRYYEWQFEPIHDAVRLVAVRNGRVVGFCFGGVFHGALSGFVRRNAGVVLRAVATRPTLLMNARFRRQFGTGVRLFTRIIRRRVGRSFAGGPPVDAAPRATSFGILAIATDPLSQQRGVGRLLMEVAETEASRRGFPRMNLSVHSDNDQAIRFYEKLGWTRVLRAGQWLGEMERSIETPTTHRGYPSDT